MIHPLVTTRNVAIAGAAGSAFWLYSLCTFSANEFKTFELREMEDGSKSYVQVVDVKTHSVPSRLLAAAFLLGFTYISAVLLLGFADEQVTPDEEDSQVKVVPSSRGKTADAAITSLPTPALFVPEEEEDEQDCEIPIPATDIQSLIQPPVYDEAPVVQSQPVADSDDLTSKVLSDLYRFPKKHLIVVAETGAGKTSLLLGLVKTAYESTAGAVDMYICTVKAGSWMGLEDEKDEQGGDRYVYVDQVTGRGISQVMDNLRYCREKLNARGEARKAAVREGRDKPVFVPIIFIIDEMNTLLETAKRQGTRDYFLAVVNAIANTGREDNVRVWIFGQDYQVQNLGINTGYRGNFGFALLGRIDQDKETGEETHAWEKMEAAFIGRSPLYDRSGTDYWAEAYSLITENKGAAVIWTSLSRRACLMPYLPRIEYERLWGATEPIEVEPSIEMESAQLENNSDSTDQEAPISFAFI